MSASEKEYAEALHNTMTLYKFDKEQFVDKKQQKNILNNLCKNARSIFKVQFRSTEQDDEELNRTEWPFWRTQNDALRKIIFGTYLGNALPPPLVTAIRRIPDDRFRSFFM